MNVMTLKTAANGGAQPENERCVMVTGGAGYIGSHTVLQLLVEGFEVVVVDSLDNADEEVISRVVDLAGKNGPKLRFFKVNMCDRKALENIFASTRFDAVIHFAGVKAVGESVANPLLYYSINISGTLNLLQLMSKYGCKKFVFSSSATVYGQPDAVPCTEEFPVKALNPYGRSKIFNEEILRDLQHSDPDWRIMVLRYFNPVGAHPSGLIGEDPRGTPNNLMPYMQQVAVGRRKELGVFGNDYPTKDGTGVRDYVHVQDVATGHSAALSKIFNSEIGYCKIYNLGTGHGTSVLEMVAAFEKACKKKIQVRVSERRPGDSAEVYGAVRKMEEELGWKAQDGVEEMCRDQWNWASKNPFGYGREDESSNQVEAQGPRATAVDVADGVTAST